ncbi:hypothetical protein IWW55_007508, partial [Coemansia sp. RSA 2706]
RVLRRLRQALGRRVGQVRADHRPGARRARRHGSRVLAQRKVRAVDWAGLVRAAVGRGLGAPGADLRRRAPGSAERAGRVFARRGAGAGARRTDQRGGLLGRAQRTGAGADRRALRPHHVDCRVASRAGVHDVLGRRVRAVLGPRV